MSFFTPYRIPDEQLPQLTKAEAKRYEELLRRELATASPLDLACLIRPQTQRWPHVELLNEYLVALVEHRLYADGPGPPPRWFYRTTDRLRPVPGPHRIPDNATEFFAVHPDDPPSTGRRVVYRLAIAMPPRHGKSYLVTETLPLWYWLRYPDRDIALATYNDDKAAEWGVELRQIMVEQEKKLGLSLRGKLRSSASHLRLEGDPPLDGQPKATGQMRLVGAKGSLTGAGFQLGIIDDPFKDAADAESQAERNARANWYTSVFVTRKTRIPKQGLPVEVMMFTRWHEDDIAGRFAYDENGDPRPDWCVIRVPALSEGAGDLLDRPLGEALCPAIKTKQELLSQQEEDPFWFAALYQGTPITRKGGIIPPFRRYQRERIGGDDVYQVLPVPFEDLPTYPGSEALARELSETLLIPANECYRFATVDLAASSKSYADWSVFSVWDWDAVRRFLFLVFCHRDRIDSAQHVSWVQSCFAAHEGINFVGIEAKTFGLTLLQELARDRSVPTRPLTADTDKVSRAAPYGQQIGQGRILIPKGGLWVNAWVTEHGAFPTGKHDDQVDTGAYAWKVASQTPARRVDTTASKPLTLEEKLAEYVDRKYPSSRRSRDREWIAMMS